MSSNASSKIIKFQEGWEDEIKAKALVKLENYLNGKMKLEGKLFNNTDYALTYTVCYNMCTQRTPYNWSEDLYTKHGETIEEYLKDHVLGALKEKSDAFLLKELQHRWNNHMIMNKWLTKFFMYLDRYYVKHHSLPTLAIAGLRKFKTLIYDEVKKEVANAMLVIIDDERDGKDIDRGLLRQIVELFESMGMGTLDSYTADLEEPLLATTRDYYARKREEWIAKDSTPDYLIKAEKALEDEKERVLNYLNSHSEAKVLKVCEEELLEKCQKTLLEKEGSGCKTLLANDKTDDLERMFKLFNRLDNGLGPMAKIVEEYVSYVGNSYIDEREARLNAEEKKEKPDDPDFIKKLLACHAKYTDVIKAHFTNHPLFQKAMKDAFTSTMNRNVGNFTNAELLSTYSDRLLKAGGEKMSEAAVDESLDKIVELFSYLDDKDFFGEVFRNQLAKRLLNQKSASDDLEKAMISKLKVQVGTQFTSKMEGMLNDLTTALEHEKSFKEFREKDAEKSRKVLDTTVQVLTTGNWPTYQAPEVALPNQMQPAVDQFMRFYNGEGATRRLKWFYSLGTVKIRAIFPGKEGKKAATYDFEVATLQAAAIMAFEEGKSYTFTELGEKLMLKPEYLRPVMHSLCCGKYKVVAKNPTNNKINEKDSFTVNRKFKSPNKKVKIPMASLDSNANTKKVEEDRSITIDAALVRIMKSRKTLPHQTLISEVLSQLVFFKPQAKQIKKRIESLLEREYLERSEDNPGSYNYLA